MNKPEKMDLTSGNITEEQKEKLKQLFPEVFTEGGKVDFEKLKLTLGETVDIGKERYGMNWPGKAECFKTIQKPSMATLVPVKSESVNFDETGNLIIEGDNLEVLKLLQKSYMGKIKMIYIDPPYNTGNDFIYPDNYSESLETYLEYTGQVDSEGRKFSTNTEADGRFHSKWMNMMYPRLFLARNLLRDDGIMFISIDDSEVDNLKKICNEIFGEENFTAQFVWQSRQSMQNDTDISVNHQYIIGYARNRRQQERRLKPNNKNHWFNLDSFAAYPLSTDKNKFSNPDNDLRGPWKADPFDAPGIRENLEYEIVNPKTKEKHLPPVGRHWRTEETKYLEYSNDKRIVFGKTGQSRPQLKVFLKEQEEFGQVENTWFDGDYAGTVTEGTREIQDLFSGTVVFDYPKPTVLLKRLMLIATKENDFILDFFGGSGTTADAVLTINKELNSSRKFILVQLPEPTNRKDYPTIAEITKDRVRKVIKNLVKKDSSQLSLGAQIAKQDEGFRVFKLSSSNFKSWNNENLGDAEKLGKQLEMHVDHILKDRSQDDILYEILLKSGYPLTTEMEILTLAGKKVYSVQDSSFLICLEKSLTLEVIRAIADKKPQRVVCLDEGFTRNDQLKTNAVQTFKSKGVTKFLTV